MVSAESIGNGPWRPKNKTDGRRVHFAAQKTVPIISCERTFTDDVDADADDYVVRSVIKFNDNCKLLHKTFFAQTTTTTTKTFNIHFDCKKQDKSGGSRCYKTLCRSLVEILGDCWRKLLTVERSWVQIPAYDTNKIIFTFVCCIVTIVAVWPDWAIYGILGNFSKPLAALNLPKSLTFLVNLCKGVKLFNFSSEIIFGQLL